MSMLRISTVIGFCTTLALGAFAGVAHAQDREVPYWAAMRYDEVNMRVGPSGEYRIEWVYRRQGLPVRVVRLREGWRLVQDHEGTQGWIAASQLTPTRYVMIIGDDLADLREDPDPQSALRWRAEAGVVGQLGDCDAGYCEIDVEGRTGWVDQDRLWGTDEPPTDP